MDAGQVFFGYQHFVILGPESQAAAEASECAAEQRAFWPYHDLLYNPEGSANWGFAKDNLEQLAVELGLDSAAFDACLDSGKHTSVVGDETAIIPSLGVRGTPAFLINGKLLVGAQPFDVFEEIIAAEIDASEE